MKATFNRKQVLEKLSVVQKAINSRAVLPILSGVKWGFTDKGIRLSATDLSVWLSAFVEAEVKETGEIVLPRTVIEWLSKDNSEYIELSGDEKRVSMTRVGKKGEGSKFTGMDADEFPLMGNDFDQTYEMDAEELSELGVRATYAASPDDNNVVASALRLLGGNGKLVVYAFNGFKGMSKYESPFGGNFDLMVRAKDFKEIANLFDGAVTVEVGQSKIRLSDENTTAVINTIEAKFPDWEAFAGRTVKASFTVSPKEFVSVISSVRVASSPIQVKGGGDGVRQIRLQSTDEGLSVLSVGGGESSDEAVLDVDVDGIVQYVFNSDFIIEHASKVRGMLKMSFLDQGIAMFTDTKDSAWLGMTPPMRG